MQLISIVELISKLKQQVDSVQLMQKERQTQKKMA